MPSSAAVKAAIIGWGLCALLLLGGCSAVRVGYNQAPTLAWWWLDGYMDFDAEQSPRVKDALAQWFAWHRRTQLPDYADLLAAARLQVLQPVTPQQVCRWTDELRMRLATALDHAVPLAAELLPLLKPAQLTHLKQRYRKANRDFADDFLQPPDERSQAAVKRTLERAERLYGRLDERQKKRVAAGVADSPFDPEAWFAERQALQDQTLQALSRLTAGGAARADRASNRAGLQALSARMLQAPPGPYRNYPQRLADYNCAFIAQLHNSTTPAQRQAASERLASWEDDLRALALQKPPTRIEAAP